MDNKILKMVYDNMGAEATSFTIIAEKEVKIITFQASNDDDEGIMGNINSQSVLDSYVMENADDGALIKLIEEAKEGAVSWEEISQKAFEYSIKELSEKQLKYMLS